MILCIVYFIYFTDDIISHFGKCVRAEKWCLPRLRQVRPSRKVVLAEASASTSEQKGGACRGFGKYVRAERWWLPRLRQVRPSRKWQLPRLRQVRPSRKVVVAEASASASEQKVAVAEASEMMRFNAGYESAGTDYCISSSSVI